jgi:phasin
MADTFNTKAKNKPLPAPQLAETPKFDPRTFELPKSEAPKPEAAKSEAPKFEAPKFEMPNLEVPAAFREFAEKGVTQARDNWEKMKTATEEANGAIENSYNTATKGLSDYGLKMIELSQANANAMFGFCSQLMAVRSLSEAVELSTSHARQQFETVTAQTRDLSSLAQKVATEAAAPIKDGLSGAFKKVA